MAQVKKIPMRTCTGCRQAKNKKELIRVVKNQEGMVFVDATGKQNGRGAYLCPNAECLAKAVKNKGLERALKTAVSEELYEKLRKALGDDHE